MNKITMSFRKGFTVSDFPPLDGLLVENKEQRDTLILIAAAPELLEALEIALRVENVTGDNNFFWVKNAQEVIAKATGK